jgi:hypothetical protein
MMVNSKLTIGDPPAITVDYDTSSVVAHYKNPGNNITLWDVWQEKFKDIKECQLFLSGGLDSQFSLHLLKTLGIKVDALICDMRWNDVTVNAHDVMSAQRYAELNGITYRMFTLDLKEHFESEEYVEMALKYRTTSPQITAQIKMLELAATDTCMLGGDPTIIRQDKTREKTTLVNADKAFVLSTLCAFYNFANDRNIQVIKDPFKMDHHTNYLSVEFNLDVIQTYNTYFAELTAYNDSNYTYKQHYYSLLGAKLMPPLYKATGFETVKKMLAQESGVYNQFDKLYRLPLYNLIMSQPWAKNLLTKTSGDHFRGPLNEVLVKANEIINNSDMNPCNVYRFDF